MRTKIEDDAKAFKREKDAERQRRLRSGIKVREIPVHDATCIPTLVAMGFLRDVDIENNGAINEAFAAFIRHYCHNPKYSKQTGWEAASDIWHEENKSAPWRLKRDEQNRRHAKRLVEGGHSDGGRNPDQTERSPEVLRDRDNRPTKISPLPRVKVERKRGGDAKGRNPMLTTATIYNARGMVIGKYAAKSITPKNYPKIKPDRGASKKFERKHGRLTLPDKSVHTVASKAGEVDRKLDQQSAASLGWVKRVVTQEYDGYHDDKDDPGSYS